MTNTHTVQDIEGLMSELFMKLKDNNLTKKEHTEIVKKLKYYEQHFRNVQDKQTNGKKYPPKDTGYLSDKPMDKEEILKIISKTDTHENNDKNCYVEGCYSTEGVYVEDPSGISLGQKRFIEIDQDIDIRTSILETYNKAKQ